MSEARGTRVLGQATYVSTLQPSNVGGVWTGGSSTYTFASPEPCMFAVDCPTGVTVGVIDVKYENGVYTIGVYGGTTQNSAGLDVQVPVTVWAVSMITSASSNYGLVMWNSAGQVTHDFGQANGTFPVSAGDFYEPADITGVTRPVVFGNSPFYAFQFFDRENNSYEVRNFRGYLTRGVNNTIRYASCLVFYAVYPGVPPDPPSLYTPSPFIVMEGAVFP